MVDGRWRAPLRRSQASEKPLGSLNDAGPSSFPRIGGGARRAEGEHQLRLRRHGSGGRLSAAETSLPPPAPCLAFGAAHEEAGPLLDKEGRPLEMERLRHLGRLRLLFIELHPLDHAAQGGCVLWRDSGVAKRFPHTFIVGNWQQLYK